MTQPTARPPRLGKGAAIALRFALLLGLVVLATWVSHLVREALGLQITPENEQQMYRVLMLGTVIYVGLLAIPFVPGAELGVALFMAFGASIAPLVYGATALAMVLSYTVGRMLPITILARLLAFFRLRQTAVLIHRAELLAPEDRVALILEGAPPRLLALVIRHRYIALALAVNLPGNVVIGGGGGIMMLAGMSGIFAPVPTLLAILIAVAPVPLVVFLIGA
ncbi:hypothetical protein [Marivita sp.]|uniref:hypothetical protein n=1 Tax=Marivita sp. TaxID=2003365 RepID=UPI003F71D038